MMKVSWLGFVLNSLIGCDLYDMLLKGDTASTDEFLTFARGFAEVDVPDTLTVVQRCHKTQSEKPATSIFDPLQTIPCA